MRALTTPVSIACAIEALTDPASDAQGLQPLHRFGRLVGERVERVCGESELVDRGAGRFEREPSEPRPPRARGGRDPRLARPGRSAARRRARFVGARGQPPAPDACYRSRAIVETKRMDSRHHPCEHMFAGKSSSGWSSEPGSSLYSDRSGRCQARAVSCTARVAFDRVAERRRAVALARHYRDQESLSIAEIARRLGRAQATVKAYLYDPTGEKARECS